METHTLPPAEKERRPVAVLVLLWLAKLAAAGILGMAAWLKVTGHQADVDLFRRLEWEPLGRYLIGALESVAAVLILIPQSAVYGAFLGLGIMVGAIIGHLTAFQLDGVQYAAFVGLCCVTVLYIRRADAKFIRNLWDR